MDALEAVLTEPQAFPSGLFWLHRGEHPPFERVTRLLISAAAANVECGIVRIDNFDETMLDLLRLLPGVDTASLRAEAQERRRFSFAPAPVGTKSYPMLRLNALAVVHPTNCRKVVCDVGNAKNVREIVEAADARLIVARTRAGVIGFGSDNAFKKTFQSFGIVDFGLLTFEDRRLRYESQERGLLRRALVTALAQTNAMDVRPRGTRDLLAPKEPTGDAWQKLRDIVGQISGTVPRDRNIIWREGISLRLEWASDRLWLLFEPRTIFDNAGEETKAITSDFARERTVRRYNPILDKLINHWSHKLAGENIRALGIGNGIDAAFTIGNRSAFSWSAKP